MTACTAQQLLTDAQAQLSERPPVLAPGVPPEIAAQLQSLREEARTLQEERVKLHAELARLQQAMQSLQTPKGHDVGSAVAAAVASARQRWDLELQQLKHRCGCLDAGQKPESISVSCVLICSEHAGCRFSSGS